MKLILALTLLLIVSCNSKKHEVQQVDEDNKALETTVSGKTEKNMNAQDKKFMLSASDMKNLVSDSRGCFATDRITVDGQQVDYMYREASTRDEDSGWRFFAGDETQEYIDDLKNTSIFSLNTIANYDESIIPYLNSPVGSAFGRIEGTNKFEAE